MLHFNRKSMIGVIIILALVVGALVIHAQGGATPITIGQNTAGQITDANTPVLYTISVTTAESANIQVFASSPGLAPTFRLFDPDGIVIFDAANPGMQTIAAGTASLEIVGSYTLEVRSANATTGQFLVSVQTGVLAAAPLTPLAVGQAVHASVDTQTPREDYGFTASTTDVLLLHVTSDTTSDPLAALRDANSGELFGLSDLHPSGVVYRIPMGTINYLLDVVVRGNDPEGYTVCLSTESGSITCPGGNGGGSSSSVTPVPTNTLDPNGACEVASSGNTIDNIRSGPGTLFSVVGQLPPNSTALIIGRLPNNSWYQVNYNGIIGWISAAVVTIGGNCGNVPVIPQPNPQPTDTLPPQVLTGAPLPSATQTSSLPRVNVTGTRIHIQRYTPTPTPRFQVQPSLQFGPTFTPTHVVLHINRTPTPHP